MSILVFALGLVVGAAVGAIATWWVLRRGRTIRPPTGKLGDRLPSGSVPDDRYPLW